MIHVYDMGDRLRWSSGFERDRDKILLTLIPGARALRPPTKDEDRSGTDVWVVRSGAPDLSVDIKAREDDYAPKGKDDLPLETWSVIKRDPIRLLKPGWTRNPEKRTDYVLWFWAPTGRYFLTAFHPLCSVFSRHWRRWALTHQTDIQCSGDWFSECTFVPRGAVIAALDSWASGHLADLEISEDEPCHHAWRKEIRDRRFGVWQRCQICAELCEPVKVQRAS